VFLLFHELVAPALARVRGLSRPLPPLVTGIMSEALSLKKTGILNLKGAVARLQGPTLLVRPARAREAANAIIHVPARRRHLQAGERVRLRLLAGQALR
jgi:hypothetical protein